MEELRQHNRFYDFGRVECSNLCVLPGILTDISLSGLKVTYNAPVSVVMEEEYEVHIRLSKLVDTQLTLLVVPVWKFEQGDKTQLGFSILWSKDSNKLEEYISMLSAEEKSFERVSEQEEVPCQFI
jgi:ERCC4-type nuclease